MNKLISRNPVQRFKEGQKIQKFEKAGIISYKGRDNKNYEAFSGPKGWYYREKGSNQILRMPKNYITTTGIRFYDTNGNMINNPSTAAPVTKKSFQKGFLGDDVKKAPAGLIVKGGSNRKSSVKTPISVRRVQKDWNNEFANNFTNTLTQAQRQYLDSKGINYTNAANVQKFLMDQLQTDLGGYKDDGKWDKNSIQAWKDFAANNIPKNFDVTQEQKNMNIETKPYTEVQTPTANFGYRTSNTYENNDFLDRLRNMGIRSNADLIDFMYRTNGANYNWNGDNWARQFRSDVNQALGGNYSDDNIRKVFNTSGNWHRGFLGRGDLGDFQNALQTYAGTWNGSYDRNLGNYVKNIDWTKFKLFKQGGQLPSRNPVKRFKQRNFRLVAQ